RPPCRERPGWKTAAKAAPESHCPFQPPPPPHERLMMTVLLIDDDTSFRITLAAALRRRGCEVAQAATGGEALTMPAMDCGPEASFAPEGIVLDMRLGQESGMALIPQLKARYPQARLVVLTGYGSIPNAIEAVRLGAD